jgi:hypothetical protein
MKQIIKLALPFVVALLVGACGNGLSTQEAYAICESEQSRNPAIDDAAFAACVACYEDCSDCIVQSTAPATFACPDDLAEDAAEEG